MKMVFLFKREVLPLLRKEGKLDEESLPEFFGWKYGPFSTDVLNDLEFLLNRCYVESHHSKNSPSSEEMDEYQYWIEDIDSYSGDEMVQYSYSLSKEKGIAKGKSYWDELSIEQRKIITNFKSSLADAPLRRILEYVYRRYGDDGLIDNSVIKHKFF